MKRAGGMCASLSEVHINCGWRRNELMFGREHFFVHVDAHAVIPRCSLTGENEEKTDEQESYFISRILYAKFRNLSQNQKRSHVMCGFFYASSGIFLPHLPTFIPDML